LDLDSMRVARSTHVERSGEVASHRLNRLHRLEAQGRHLFHRSALRLDLLEPRRAYTFVSDGPPAVFASTAVDHAIFMALVNCINCPTTTSSSSTDRNGVFRFGACEETSAQLDAATKGYVHVLDRCDSNYVADPNGSATKQVEPVAVLEVKRADFHPEIIIIAPLKPRSD
jgi:hypothetical protein